MSGNPNIIKPVRYNELAGVVEVLYGTFGSTSEHGLFIECVEYSSVNRVRFSDPADPDSEPIEMSTRAYAAEFYKACGGDLQSANFDEVLRDLTWVGDMLGNTALSRGTVTFDDLRTGAN